MPWVCKLPKVRRQSGCPCFCSGGASRFFWVRLCQAEATGSVPTDVSAGPSWEGSGGLSELRQLSSLFVCPSSSPLSELGHGSTGAVVAGAQWGIQGGPSLR